MATYNSNTESLLINNKTLHETKVSIDKHGNILEGGGSFEFLLNVSKGIHRDASFEHKTGYIQSGFADGDTVWEPGVAYPWSSLNTAQTIYVKSSSNNASDRNLPITIIGLDSTWNVQTETVTLNASDSTIAVTFTKQFLRINSVRAHNGVTNAGDITLRVTSGSGTIVEIIPAGFGNSMSGIYSVPYGFTGYLLKGSATCTSASVFGFFIRYFEEAFSLQHIAIADSGQYMYDFPIPLPFPEKTDMDVRGIIGTGRAAVNWDMILYKNT